MDGLRDARLGTIRVRLTAALGAALLPVLILGVLQSSIAFWRQDVALRESLAQAAVRSAADARARLEAADILLQTLAPGSVGFQCAQRLSEVVRRIPGYANLVRLDARGRVACAAENVPPDPGRRDSAWFRALAEGQERIVTRDTGGGYADGQAVLSAVRTEDAAGRFGGALVAVITLESLQPRLSDRALPPQAMVALTDDEGRYITSAEPAAFGPLPRDWRPRVLEQGALVWHGGAGGERRVYAVAPLLDDDVFVVLSARSPGLFSWARLNPLTGVIFPLLTFAVAFLAVWVVAERVVVRWIAYLQRIASLYVKGRMGVRPVHTDEMPDEIRELAETLEEMADAVVSRDARLRDSLAQKDALMREIHHRVKNNLQVISSLLSMQQRALTDPAARAAMSDTRQRITALALIYRALYQGPDLKRVDLRPFLEELTAQLVAGDVSSGPAVRTELHVEALIIDPDRLAPLALFAVEAITNAQKHAFAGRGGLLQVDFKVKGEEAELSICDDGPSGDEALAASGVGRTLMTAFARQLRGRAELTRNEMGGITAKLIFPAPVLEPATEAGNPA